jgi:lysylphosphatidylglycerol synthetase-like protein (DUF2156 family)
MPKRSIIDKDLAIDWIGRILLVLLFLSEFAGVQIAIFTPDLPIPLALFIVWIMLQCLVSAALLLQVWHALRRREKEAWRLANIVLVCIALLVLGVFQSHQLFAGVTAISDSFLLYLAYHWD